ncbi:hypothetical protein NIES4106_16840 [Fischerella sp. NIES-4106]|jgi:hypothetical protein|nr:hypothetical protein NIES4106_16840 [Fischerella sp. NIES-4106]
MLLSSAAGGLTATKNASPSCQLQWAGNSLLANHQEVEQHEHGN